MAVNKENPFLVYGTLAGAVAVAIVTLVDFSISKDIASDPYARPDPFTGSDFDRFYKHEFIPVKERQDDCRDWQERHVSWGRQRAGRNDEMHRNLEESVRSLQSQVLYLYQQHEKD